MCVSGRESVRLCSAAVHGSTHLDRPTNPEEHGDSYLRTRFAETGRKVVSKARKRGEGRLGLLHPRFDSQRLPDLVLADERGVGGRVRPVS